ncbi:MAG: hypothetical protein AAF805_15255 [Planctomycetota bacterium]
MGRREAELPITGAYHLDRTLSQLTMGRGNPTLRHTERVAQLTLATPEGPVAVAATHKGTPGVADAAGDGGMLRVVCDGAGADWVMPHMSALFGLRDDPSGFAPDGRLGRVAQEQAGVRLVRFPAIFHRLVQVVLQQLIAFRDACRGWRLLVTRHGDEVPGSDGLYYAPTAERIAGLAVYQLMECEITPKHARVILAMAKQAAAIERRWNAGDDPAASNDSAAVAAARDRLCGFLESQPGVGPWTTGYLRGTGLGDADALVLGDYGHPHQVAYFFTGEERSDDAEMVRLLAPFRPHRFRVLQLLIAGAPTPPRRGPRRARLGERFR